MPIDFVNKRRFMIYEIDLDGAKALVRDLPFKELLPQDMLDIRKAMKLNQDALADFLGVADNTVYRWEKDINDIPPTISLAITALCFMRITYEAERGRATLAREREEQAKRYIDPEREEKIFGKKSNNPV